MKKPQYVAIVCRIYSRLLKLLDEKRLIYPEDEELRQLMQAFNRERTIGYWQGNPGASLISYTRPNNRGLFLGRILEAKNGHIRLRLQQPLHRGDGLEIWVSGQREGFTVSGILLDGEQAERAEPGDTVSLPAPAGLPGDRVFKTYDAPLMEGAELSYQNLPQKPLEFEVFACRGRALRISARDADGYQAEAASDYVVTAAKKAGPSLPLLQSQLGRLGGSGYTLGKVRGEIEDSILLPSSVLNQLRRELVDSLFAQRRAKDAARPFDEAHFTSVGKKRGAPA